MDLARLEDGSEMGVAQTSGAEERLGCISGFWAPHPEEEILQERQLT